MDKLYVNLADTPSKQAQGLMFVKNMPNDEGMLFDFSRKQVLSFWGSNTFIPLDIAFVDEGGYIRKISKISPMSEKMVTSGVPCKYAIEANDGYFESMNLEPGDKMKIHDNEDCVFLTFDSKRRNNDRTSSNLRARQILSQIMNQEEVYDIPPIDAVEPLEEEDASLPTISVDELGKFLEDEVEEPPLEVKPEEDEMPTPEKAPSIEERTVEYPSFDNAFDALDWAEKEKEVVRIAYTTSHGTGIVRDIEPHGQFHADTTGHQILVTFDETIGDIRAFIMKNITQFSFTGSQFKPKFKVA